MICYKKDNNLFYKMNRKTKYRRAAAFITAVVISIQLCAQQNKAAAYTGSYKNIFKEAGYKQAAIDAKVEKAYTDLFESPAGIYFEVNDSMAYVSDIKNHDARSEALSFGIGSKLVFIAYTALATCIPISPW